MTYSEGLNNGPIVTEAAETTQLDEAVSPIYLGALGRVAAQKGQGFEHNVDPNGPVNAFDSAMPILGQQADGGPL